MSMVQKFWVQKFCVHESLGTKVSSSTKIKVKRKFGPKKFGLKILGQDKFGRKKCILQKLRPLKNWVQKIW